MNNRKALLVVVLPLVVFCSWLGKVMLDANSAKHAILSIQGFDPRDLLLAWASTSRMCVL